MLAGVFDDIVNLAEKEATQRLNQNYGTSDQAIAAQNAAVDYFAGVLNAYHAGTYTPAQAANLVRAASDRFVAYATALHTSRATNGAHDVSHLAAQIISDLAASSGQIFTPPIIPGGTGGPVVPIPGTSPAGGLNSITAWITQNPVLAIGGVAAFMYFSGGRGRGRGR